MNKSFFYILVFLLIMGSAFNAEGGPSQQDPNSTPNTTTRTTDQSVWQVGAKEIVWKYSDLAHIESLYAVSILEIKDSIRKKLVACYGAGSKYTTISNTGSDDWGYPDSEIGPDKAISAQHISSMCKALKEKFQMKAPKTFTCREVASGEAIASADIMALQNDFNNSYCCGDGICQDGQNGRPEGDENSTITNCPIDRSAQGLPNGDCASISCVGGDSPVDAILCPNASPTVPNTPVELVTTCGISKCQYTCRSGYKINSQGTACEKDDVSYSCVDTMATLFMLKCPYNPKDLTSDTNYIAIGSFSECGTNPYPCKAYCDEINQYTLINPTWRDPNL
jgi:hypothetical protein